MRFILFKQMKAILATSLSTFPEATERTHSINIVFYFLNNFIER